MNIIPNGTNAVITHDDKCARDVALMEAIKDAEADLERSGNFHFGETVKTVKDSEANLERSAGTRYGSTIGSIKDVECNLDRLLCNRFADLTQDVKDTEVAVHKAHGLTRDVVRQAEIATEEAKCQILDTVRQAEHCNSKEECETRSLVSKEASCLKDRLCDAEKELGATIFTGFKESLLEEKNSQNLMYRLVHDIDKTLCCKFSEADKERSRYGAANALAFKEVELQAERLACKAAKERMEEHCEIKELIRSDGEKTRCILTYQETERQRDRATKAEAQLAAYYARGKPPVFP